MQFQSGKCYVLWNSRPMDPFTQSRPHHTRRDILKSGALALLPLAIRSGMELTRAGDSLYRALNPANRAEKRSRRQR